MKKKIIKTMALILVLVFSFAGCTPAQDDSTTSKIQSTVTAAETSAQTSTSTISTDSASIVTTSSEGSMLDTTDLFSDRDLEQTSDLTDAKYITLESGSDETITEEGVYVLSGSMKDVTVIVEAADDAKVQLILDGINIVNEDAPAIYVKTADKVFITTTDSDNYLKVSGTFAADGDTNLDAVIFSKSDLVLNGTGTLEVVSTLGNGITSKDDIKVTGGAYVVTSAEDGLEANDSILIYDGNLTINSGKDALHSENEDDVTLGYIYIAGGTLNITAAEDGIQGTSIVQIDSGDIDIVTSTESIEGTYIQINGGNINAYATDDGINATNKSTAYDVVIEVNGGNVYVKVGSGDTDGFDSNGSLYINGGNVSVDAVSAFDVDKTAELNSGKVTVNGETVTEIPQSRMGGGMKGGFGKNR